MAVVHRFVEPDRFVVGTVGRPGDRTFFLQVRDESRLLSVSLEKQQVSVLAERIDDIVDQVTADGLAPATTPTGHTPPDLEPLDNPIEEEFRVGTMTLAWDNATHLVVLELLPIDADDDDPDELIVIQIGVDQAKAFARRATTVVEAGRPNCPFCGESIDPQGHICVRANGYRRRQ